MRADRASLLAGVVVYASDASAAQRRGPINHARALMAHFPTRHEAQMMRIWRAVTGGKGL